MSELLDSFIPEARDLLQRAGAGMLRLERAPDDEDVINDVFRAVHTLKGCSGLFEIAPFTRLVHAAEDVLSAVRERRLALGSDMTDALLGGLDVVGGWVDALETGGALPGDAATLATRYASSLRVWLPDQTAAANAEARSPAAALPEWIAAIDADARQAIAASATPGLEIVAIDYTPAEGCFFQGEDPLHLMRRLPGLAWLAIEPREAWPALEALDPFRCTLRLMAIVAAPFAEIEHLLRYVADQVVVARLAADTLAGGSASAADPWGEARTLIGTQREILDLPGTPAEIRSRIPAVAQAVRTALTLNGRTAEAERLSAILDTCDASGDPAPLAALIDALLAGPAPAAVQSGGASAAPGVAREEGAGANRFLRVEQSKVDALMNLVGELIVAKNGLGFLGRKAEQGAGGPRFAREIRDQQAGVDRIARDLQHAVMAIRMLPVATVFQRLPRLVRDIARKLGKEVELELQGENTEIDKNIVDTLFDPLLHMVRNSLDHGLETTEERIAAGKPATGRLVLAAARQGDSVVVTLTDDGRGIHGARVKAKALERGLISAERAATMTADEAVDLIFMPGFSTAATVSDLSGRGVGMDVVRTTIRRLGGAIGVSTRLGEGTVVRLTLPLSMVVTQIMTVGVQGRSFGILLDAVQETVRIPRAHLKRMRDREAIILRDRVLPVLRLASLLDLGGGEPREEEAILVVRIGGDSVGIVVDGFEERMETIVKPLQGMLAGMTLYSGTTLLGDGRVLLILNLAEVINGRAI